MKQKDYIGGWNYVNTIVYYNEEYLTPKEYGEDSIKKTAKIGELQRTDGVYSP